MLVRVYTNIVNRHRKYKYEKKFEKYKQQSHSGDTILIAYPTAIMGYFAGKSIGQDARAFFNSVDSVPGVIIRRFHGPMIFVLFFILGSVIFRPMEFFLDESLYAAVVLMTAVAPVVHANYLARQDIQTMKQLRQNTNQTTPETVQEAFQNIHHYHHSIRESAFRVLQQAFQDSPGWAVKSLSAEPETISDSLLKCLDYDDVPTVRGSLICLKWFSRDFATLLISESDRFPKYVNSDRSDIQAPASVILGNIGANNPENIGQYASALTPAVKDIDAEVRLAAAVSLENLPCQQTIKMLKHLRNDSDAEVCQQANESLQRVKSSLRD